jgi:hypothetical protein
MINLYNIFVGKPDSKRSIGRVRHMWEDDIKIDLTEKYLEVVGLIHLAQNRGQRRKTVNTVPNLLVQQEAGNSMTN